MPLRLGSRRKAYKASADGNFDDIIDFDAEPFSSPISTASISPPPPPSSVLPDKLQKGPVRHAEGEIAANMNKTLDITLESTLTPSPMKSGNASSSAGTTHNPTSPIGKRGRFKFMKFRRKSKKESSRKKAKNKPKEYNDTSNHDSNKNTNRNNNVSGNGMTMLVDDDDDGPESGHVTTYESEADISYGGDHTTTWEADNEDDHEAGLQVDLHPLTKSRAYPDTMSSTNDGGFFATTFDFRTAVSSRNNDFPSVVDDSGFLSFEAAEDWNPSSGDFQSFANGDMKETETKSAPSIYTAYSPSIADSNDMHNHDVEREGPIDSDTLEEWDVLNPSAHCYNPDTSQLLSGHTDLALDNNTPEQNFPSNISSDSNGDGFGVSSPIDVDTLQPWAPTQQSLWKQGGQESCQQSRVTDDEAFKSKSERKHSSPVLVSDVQETFEDMWNKSETDSYNDQDFAETDNLYSAGHDNSSISHSEKIGSEAASLTLGMLAQISGLVDYDAVNADQYGRTYQDNTMEEDYADSIAQAVKKTLEDHEKASLVEESKESTFVAFHDDCQPLDDAFPEESASPFTTDVSKIDSSGDLHNDSNTQLLLDSSFEKNLFSIESCSNNQQIQPVPTNELDVAHECNDLLDSLAAPRALEGAFENIENDEHTARAEMEMEQLISQIKGRWEEPVDNLALEPKLAHVDEKKEEFNISKVQTYWKEKEEQLLSIHTDSRNTIKTREVDVEWPDAPVSSSLKAKSKTATEVGFLSSSKKNAKRWDVPSSVFTSGNPDASLATDMSSLCGQSYDLTEDGFQVPKRKSAKEAYRATHKSVSSSNSAKGFFWRSHPEGPTDIGNVEVKPRPHPKKIKKKREVDELQSASYSRPSRVKKNSSTNSGEDHSEYVDFHFDSLTRKASRDEEESQLKPANASALERIKSMPAQVKSNVSVPWDKENLKLRNVNLSRNMSGIKPKNQSDENKKSSPTMEWRKAIEAKIKSTSEKVKAVRNNATSPISFVEKKPPIAPSKPNLRRAPSPFQANRNTFLTMRQTPAKPAPTKGETIIYDGVPRTIDKRALDDDAISGCSGSIADKIKQFETKSQTSESVRHEGGRHGIFNRATPLNSFALSKLRNVTNNVEGLWA